MTALSHPSYTQIEHVQKHPRDANVEGVGSKGAELMQYMGFELLESMSMLRCVFVSFILGTHPLFPSISVCSWFSSLFQDTRTWKSQWMMPGLWTVPLIAWQPLFPGLGPTGAILLLCSWCGDSVRVAIQCDLLASRGTGLCNPSLQYEFF